MRYVLLVSNDETAPISSQERAWREAAFLRFQNQMRTRGVTLVGERMQPSETATTVRCWDGGDVIVSAGPSAQAGEQLTGVLVLDCDDLNEAIEVATAVPAAWYGTVEIRPVLARASTAELADLSTPYLPELGSVVDTRAV